jgi:hypothetical protein
MDIYYDGSILSLLTCECLYSNIVKSWLVGDLFANSLTSAWQLVRPKQSSGQADGMGLWI